MDIDELRLLLEDVAKRTRPLKDILAEIREEKVDTATLEEAAQASREQLQEFMQRNNLCTHQEAANYFDQSVRTLSRWLNPAQRSAGSGIPTAPSRRILGISDEDWGALRKACADYGRQSPYLPWYTDAVLERGVEVQRQLNEAIEPMLSAVDAAALIDRRGDVLLTDSVSDCVPPDEREEFYAAIGLIAAPFLPGFRAPTYNPEGSSAAGSAVSVLAGPTKHVRIRFNSQDKNNGVIRHLLGVVSVDERADLFLAFLSFKMIQFNELRFSLATSRCVFGVRQLFGLGPEGERP